MSDKAFKTSYAKLRTGNRISLVDESPIAAPLTIYLEPTNICNFKCVYCPESFSDFEKKTGGFHQLSLPDFHRIADQIRELGAPKVLNFYMMGEPFANKNTIDFIRIAMNTRLAERICVTTNGSLLRPATIDKLLDTGVDFIRISIYGGTPEAHARRTNSKIGFERIVEGVAQLHQQKKKRGLSSPHLYVKMIDGGDPVENEAFRHIFSGICDEIAIEPAMNWNDPEGSKLAQKPVESFIDSEYFRHKKSACPFPFYTLVIHSDLRVSPCCVDWEKTASVGNLRHETLSAIWRGRRMREFRLEHLRGNRRNLEACARCTYLFTVPDNVDMLVPDAYVSRC